MFHRQFVYLLWLREMDPFSISYRQEKKNACDSFIPKRVRDGDNRFCLCGLSKPSTENSSSTICTSIVMNMVKQSVNAGKVTPELKQFLS